MPSLKETEGEVTMYFEDGTTCKVKIKDTDTTPCVFTFTVKQGPATLVWSCGTIDIRDFLKGLRHVYLMKDLVD